MATLRNKGKLAALNKEKWEEHPRSNLAQNSNVPRSQEDYITQVSEEIEGRVTKKFSQEFSKTENRILGALARLDDFLMNPLIQGHSGTAPETSRNALSTSQRTNEDDSQSEPHPEAGILNNQMTQNFGPEDGHDMVTGVHEEVTYCSPVHLQESRKRTALPVNRNSAVRKTWNFESLQVKVLAGRIVPCFPKLSVQKVLISDLVFPCLSFKN